MSKANATSGKIPIITNSVIPIPKPPIAKDNKAFFVDIFPSIYLLFLFL